jgi:hypothetical protein
LNLLLPFNPHHRSSDPGPAEQDDSAVFTKVFTGGTDNEWYEWIRTSMDDPVSRNHSSLCGNTAHRGNAMTDLAALKEEFFLENELNQRPLRSTFAYPVKLVFLTKKSEHITFGGCLRDISTSGACVEFEDRHGRCSMNGIGNTKIRIAFSILDGEKVEIFAQVKWVKKVADRTGSIKIGIEFKYMESWGAIDRLIGMKNKDRNMMWNLWEQLLK